MIVETTRAGLRKRLDTTRRADGSVALVPTMGYLHDGHRSLLRAARADADVVVLSIFVNPLQFDLSEDLGGYPRDWDGDCRVARAEGVDVVFAPSVEEMYPGGKPRTLVHVDGLTAGMCGAARPGHFDGVTTVVTKLFAITGPSTAYFGRKDYQQLAVVSRMVKDLDLPVRVVGCPIVREPDGLALSSRNAYLDADERAAAGALPRGLRAAAALAAAGESRAASLVEAVSSELRAEARVRLEYVECRDAFDLTPVADVRAATVLASAARVGRARLIDNIVLTPTPYGIDIDLGVTAEPRPAAFAATTASHESEAPCTAR